MNIDITNTDGTAHDDHEVIRVASPKVGAISRGPPLGDGDCKMVTYCRDCREVID